MTPQEARKALVAALRSGKYYQTTQQLKGYAQYTPDGEFIDTDDPRHDKTGFCCLGVACDLYAKEHAGEADWTGDVFVVNRPYEHDVYEEDCRCEDCRTRDYNSETDLPYPVMRWLGFRDSNGSWASESSEDGQTNLAGLNDTGRTFKFIADFIESHDEALTGEES